MTGSGIKNGGTSFLSRRPAPQESRRGNCFSAIWLFPLFLFLRRLRPERPRRAAASYMDGRRIWYNCGKHRYFWYTPFSGIHQGIADWIHLYADIYFWPAERCKISVGSKTILNNHITFQFGTYKPSTDFIMMEIFSLSILMTFICMIL